MTTINHHNNKQKIKLQSKNKINLFIFATNVNFFKLKYFHWHRICWWGYKKNHNNYWFDLWCRVHRYYVFVWIILCGQFKGKKSEKSNHSTNCEIKNPEINPSNFSQIFFSSCLFLVEYQILCVCYFFRGQSIPHMRCSGVYYNTDTEGCVRACVHLCMT